MQGSAAAITPRNVPIKLIKTRKTPLKSRYYSGERGLYGDIFCPGGNPIKYTDPTGLMSSNEISQMIQQAGSFAPYVAAGLTIYALIASPEFREEVGDAVIAGWDFLGKLGEGLLSVSDSIKVGVRKAAEKVLSDKEEQEETETHKEQEEASVPAGEAANTVDNGVLESKEHTSKQRPSTKEKHQNGRSRQESDQGNRKGYKEPPGRKPEGHRGSWPPKNSSGGA